MSTEAIDKQTVPDGSYAVDPVHSSINFAIVHSGVTTFRSGFEHYEAQLSGGEQPKLEGTVEVKSVAIDDEMLKGVVLSPEFFDAERFPQLRFSSSEVSVVGDGTLRVLGELEIRGETREVEATGRFAYLGEDIKGKPRVGLSVESTVDRRQFGLDWQGQLPSGGDLLDYEVTINVELALVREDS
jgi:polyisoprenoid-binding protein YceI